MVVWNPRRFTATEIITQFHVELQPEPSYPGIIYLTELPCPYPKHSYHCASNDVRTYFLVDPVVGFFEGLFFWNRQPKFLFLYSSYVEYGLCVPSVYVSIYIKPALSFCGPRKSFAHIEKHEGGVLNLHVSFWNGDREWRSRMAIGTHSTHFLIPTGIFRPIIRSEPV